MILDSIKGKLVVSCQALPEEPMHSSYIMSRIAVAAQQGGAAGIRAQSAEDIKAIMDVCDLPMIGIIKRSYPDSEIYITATHVEVDALLETKCDMIALDATDRPRPNGEEVKDLLIQIHEAGRLAMADCSTYEECVRAQELGFDVVSTTLCGYTAYSEKLDGPNFALLKRCTETLTMPVIAEGKINTPEDLRRVYEECHVFSAVVGGAITRPQQITARFVESLKKEG